MAADDDFAFLDVSQTTSDSSTGVHGGIPGGFLPSTGDPAERPGPRMYSILVRLVCLLLNRVYTYRLEQHSYKDPSKLNRVQRAP